MATPTGTSGSTASNTSLHSAKREKNDEFYTRLTDIEKELRHYRSHLRGKVVFCNCDDPEWSNFWKYFTLNFEHLGLAKVVATHYASGTSSYKLEYFGEDRPIIRTPLQGDGDFRSAECIEILKESDLVVTNPPFSLFREYAAQLIEYDKKFLVIGNTNAITYKETFKFIKSNQLWLGVSPRSMSFALPDGTSKDVNACWFTNLPHKKRNEEITLFREYVGNERDYPKYDNYEAIEVSQVKNIPCDYAGCMGVPVTFLDKYNPEQFELLGMCENKDLYGLRTRVYSSQECKDTYFHLFGKPGAYDLNASGVVAGKKVFQRLLIKRKT